MTALGVASAAPRRDTRLDVLRGLCLVSMVCGHLALGRWPDTASHPLRVVDGAAGFVLLSGLVLGRVQRRRPDLRMPLRRARTIWLAHVALVLGALVLRATTDRPDYVPRVGDLGGPLRAGVDVALLRVQPDWFTVLPFYVAALLCCPLLVLALRRRLGPLVLVASVVLWALSQQGTWNPATSYGGGRWDWAGWQLLFVLGLVAGWHWDALRSATGTRRVRRGLLVAGAAAAVACLVLGQVLPVTTEPTAFDKLEVGPGVPLAVLLLAAPAYWVVGRLPLRLGAALARTGANSLRGFVVLGVVQLLLFALWPARPVGVSLLAICGVLALTWAGPKRSPVLRSVPEPRSLDRSAVRAAHRHEERRAA